MSLEPNDSSIKGSSTKDSSTKDSATKLTLEELGWNHFFQQQIFDADDELSPARIYRQDINQYHLWAQAGRLVGHLPGRFRTEAISKADLPTVGDWVLVKPITGGESDHVQIEQLFERKSKFSRKEAGDVVDEQVIAANIDTVFIVNGLDEDFNPNRIERYLMLSWDCGAEPVIVLNKSDVCDDIDAKLEMLEGISKGTPILIISATEELGLSGVRDYIKTGTTCALLGSSGVGKSTIINALLGYDRFETNAVRDRDGKGRHTTSFREMVHIPGGGLIIDTPGMREIQVWADEASLGLSFSDVEDLAAQCRFSNCRHDTEPGCAVIKAISDGELEQERLDRYFKLLQELQHLEEKQDAAARAEKKQTRKKFARLIRNRPDKRD